MTPEKNRRSFDASLVNLSDRYESKHVQNPIKHVPSTSVLSVGSKSSKLPHKAMNAVRRLSKFTDRRTLFMQQTMKDLGQRLTLGKLLQDRLRIVSDLMCFLAILGITLMIIANELIFDRVLDGDTQSSWTMKLFITMSTVVLLVLLVYYHYLDIKLYSVQNSLSDQRIGIRWRRIFLIILELIICSIHPYPETFPYVEAPKLDLNATNTPHSLSYTAVDIGLSLPSEFVLFFFLVVDPLYCRFLSVPSFVSVRSFDFVSLSTRSKCLVAFIRLSQSCIH